ncbi:GNAT family N-acetyltransferase [Candidatus Xianfuyuplasma coldseepsis]|uniref:GNAT family N-acetyltransferase n=1 Tax=Candidatus Xianfuyuplasma coldseepsis TaxID=2782163 RepID=A0A7L7KU76_9MOLU|nr:GNAT family N-acetyltransferase [Xianfuyuplasma coldseepsis]QMS85328.1 GNAT family N-acetyltransferase [Xianfuyuplasma coldseepsis]
MDIRLVERDRYKQEIAALVLRDLPEWFGIEESTKEYIETVIKYPFVAAFDHNLPIGFYSIRKENDKVLDMYVLGVLKQYHGTGVGTRLQEFVNQYANDHGYEYLMVLTLAEKKQNKEYLMTRKFYLNQGFIDFYQNDDIFDSQNPCQIMMKALK